MTDNFKMIINGQEIKLPFDMEQLFKQFIPQQIPEPIREPKIVPVRQVHQHVIRKRIECKDTEVRNVVIEMNQRLMKLEKIIGKKKDKKPIKDKPITKSKKVEKNKSPLKSKKNEKKDSKKVNKKKSKK